MIAKESPLEGMNMGTVATVAIRELQGLHTIDLRVAPGTSTQAAVAEALGMDLLAKPGRILGSLDEAHARQALCLAPDWWLLVGFPKAIGRKKVLRATICDAVFIDKENIRRDS